MKKIGLLLSIILSACVTEVPPTDDPGTYQAVPDTELTRSCEECNGPGCEAMAEACAEIESASIPLVCDPSYELEPIGEIYYAIDAHGRTVVCQCTTPNCAL